MANEFDDLSPDESKKRLKVLANKMDANKDGFVDKSELTDWIHNSLLQLDEEETRERFEEVDTGKLQTEF
jgi:Ca2+-binding EF-hand superfamily protein